MFKYIIPLIMAIIIALLISKLSQNHLITLCEIEKCPYCYGSDICKDIQENNIKLKYNSFSDIFFNIFSIKNVYFGKYNNNDNIVLKKLGHTNELQMLDKLIDQHKMTEEFEEYIYYLLNDPESINQFKICNKNITEKFLKKLIQKNNYDLKHIWTILYVNVEPLLLQIFPKQNGWPFPKFYGSCGRIVVVENCGNLLNNYQNADWHIRAYLALQLLRAATNFTKGDDNFRMYFTDVSPDNIVVDDELNVFFIDLESVILGEKTEEIKSIHYSEHFDDVNFIFNKEDICGHSISDHNIYSVCRLLLSKDAPWPMMHNGLLHSPPKFLIDKHKQLFKLIETCVDSPEKLSRFDISSKIITLLEGILF